MCNKVECQKALFNRFKINAQITCPTSALVGAPTENGYGIGYVDKVGIKRVFIIPTEAAIDLGHAIIQEIAADKSSARKELLEKRLKELSDAVASGRLAHEDVIDDLTDLLSAAA